MRSIGHSAISAASPHTLNNLDSSAIEDLIHFWVRLTRTLVDKVILSWILRQSDPFLCHSDAVSWSHWPRNGSGSQTETGSILYPGVFKVQVFNLKEIKYLDVFTHYFHRKHIDCYLLLILVLVDCSSRVPTYFRFKNKYACFINAIFLWNYALRPIKEFIW